MSRLFHKDTDSHAVEFQGDHSRHSELMRRTLLNLILIYLLPFILLTGYFHLQSLRVRDEVRQQHLQSVAEYQAHMLDLFLRERAVNLANLIQDPNLAANPSRDALDTYLRDLRLDSDSFVDVGVFDGQGVQVSYAGPFPELEKRDYHEEPWFRELREQGERFVITDIYYGFRQRPHFTIAYRREVDGSFLAMRATLDPEQIYLYITSLEGARQVHTTIVNRDGTYQMVIPGTITPSTESSIMPPVEPEVGFQEVRADGKSVSYGYAWLSAARWALITQSAVAQPSRFILGGNYRIAAISLFIILLILTATIVLARIRVRIEEDRDQTKAQLEQAAKLASVGELAGGIAHEINNPLAIISEEAGLMKDLMDPAFGQDVGWEDLRPRLDTIHEAVYRCRDITRKLLGFVRKTDITLAPHDVRPLIDEVVDGLLGRELTVSNIRLERSYAEALPSIVTDGNQLKQVILNLVNNAVDAIEGPGIVTIEARSEDGAVLISVRDSGCGMSKAQLEKIFLPFFTTKEVGRGTGLGLSVSYGIIKGLGGRISVQSEHGKGSTFTLILPGS